MRLFFETFGCVRHNPSKLGFCSHLHESSRHSKAQTSLALLIWLIENVGLCIELQRETAYEAALRPGPTGAVCSANVGRGKSGEKPFLSKLFCKRSRNRSHFPQPFPLEYQILFPYLLPQPPPHSMATCPKRQQRRSGLLAASISLLSIFHEIRNNH